MYFVYTMNNPEIMSNYEIFERDGKVYKAPISDVVMPDGFRTGIYEAERSIWDKFESVLLANYVKF